jgi:hypothetical protein
VPPKHLYASTTTHCQNPEDHHKYIKETHQNPISISFSTFMFLLSLQSMMFKEKLNKFGLLNGKTFSMGKPENNILSFCIESDISFTRILFYTNSILNY